MKEVHVQVKSDHLQRMSRVRSPIDAVAELIWNALDADASEVKVNIGTNVMGGIQNITVKDNGHGIDYVEAEPAFENLGGSWKKDVYHSKTRRRLHGKAGQGRFRAFSLGNRVTWRTRYKKPAGKIYEYTIEGNASDLGTFRISDERASRITHTGTEVRVTDVARNSPSLLANSAQQELTEQFALYLRQYPDIQIWYQDRLTNPADVERSVSDYLLEFVKGSDGKPVDAVLTIIEWNTDMERNLYLCDAFGFALETTRAGIHAPGFHFTAYLKSDFFSELADAKQLLPEFNADVIDMLDQARTTLKQHFRKRAAEAASEIVEEWKEEDVYPYEGEPVNVIEEAERQVFDVLALNLNEYLPDFDRADSLSKKVTFQLLKQAVEESPKTVQRILGELLDLPKDKQDELAALLERTSLTAIINASKQVADRLNFLNGLEILVFRPDSRETLLERSQLHKILAEQTWIFGEEFNLSVSDKSLTNVLQNHIHLLGREIQAEEVDPVLREDGSSGIVDLMLSRRIPHPNKEKREHLVVELKRPSQAVDSSVETQITSYAFAVDADERFKDQDTKWVFWAISNDLSDSVRKKAKQRHRPEGLLYDDENGRVFIWVKTWGQLIDAARARLEVFQEQLQYSADDESALEYLRKVHEQYLPKVIQSQDEEFELS
jgi:hypothetical protein